MPYVHLTPMERGCIQALKAQGLSGHAIARQLKRSPSTISRELRRNDSGSSYNAEHAQKRYSRVRDACRRTRSLDYLPLRAYVIDKIVQGWSPEQVAGTLWLEHPGQPRMRVSTETLYRSIYTDDKLGTILKPCLRRRRPRRRPHGQRRPVRPLIPNRIGIEQRPPEVEELARYGDWEGDLMLGANQEGAVLTLVERKSLFLCAQWIPSKHAHGVAQAVIRALESFPLFWRKTLTFDNGLEFAHHEDMTRALGIEVYFAHAYSAWERGRNENTNGLLRQYLPKTMSLANLDRKTLESIVNQLNQRPRKKIGFRTPQQVFLEQTGALAG